ncbi:hypothetical protein MA16_Dca011588 [Dendrobium catenatum]|uniref:Uncharacterized protein n=1 Tax=Dendrobium catenatum TaxID=906689 RepID=A0A2I0WQN3_9ASPA|nr:hypothetical protein MA16_Dca011588 [Dendrobium catenatum]
MPPVGLTIARRPLIPPNYELLKPWGFWRRVLTRNLVDCETVKWLPRPKREGSNQTGFINVTLFCIVISSPSSIILLLLSEDNVVASM